jgi:hypothetical protein
MGVRIECPGRARFCAPRDRLVGTTRPLYWFHYIAPEGRQEPFERIPAQSLRREAGRRVECRSRARASSSKNIAGGSPLTSRACTRAVRSRARASWREGRSCSRAAISRAWLTSGAMSRRARPVAVRLILVRRASSGAVRRVTSPRAASRPTTAETELWWRQRALRQLVDRRGVLLSRLVQDEHLCTADAEPGFRRPGRDPEGPHDAAQRIHHGANVDAVLIRLDVPGLPTHLHSASIGVILAPIHCGTRTVNREHRGNR